MKIDRSFVTDLSTDVHDRAIVEALLEMGRRLKLNVIAEGIETSEQEVFLKSHGCDEGQGYRFGRPQAAAHFVRSSEVLLSFPGLGS